MRDGATVCVSEDSFQKSVLPPCRFQGWNSRLEASQQALLPAELSAGPGFFFVWLLGFGLIWVFV